jgi:surface carbohydrate biosynthesis protein
LIDFTTINKKFIIFPIEIKSRDLIPRLEIASKFLEKGYYVIIGEQTAIVRNIEKLPVGILFEKSISKLKEKRFKKFQSLGFKICSLDEEGINAFHNPRAYEKSRFSYKNLNIASKIFVWGNFEKKLIIKKKKFKKFKNKIVNSGHNKINIWIKDDIKLYKRNVEKIKKKYGNFILLASNFAFPHREGDKFLIEISKKAGLLDTKKDQKRLEFNMKYRKFVFKKYLDLLKELSQQFKDKKIILRPHPSENIRKWKVYTKNIKNVKIVFKHDVSCWIKSCEHFIHSSCTTGLEAFLRRKQSISFLPNFGSKKNSFENHLSNKVSNIFRNESDIISFLKKNQKYKRRNLNKLKKFFPNISRNSKTAINMIYKNVDKIETKKVLLKKNTYSYLNFNSFFKEFFYYVTMKIQFLFNKNLKEKYYFRSDINKIFFFNKKIKNAKISYLKKNIFYLSNTND